MKDYSNGKIYAIRSAQTDDIYIGSTIQPLCVRMAGHRAHYKKHLDGKGNYITSYKILHFEDAYIELLENYACSCKDELTKREGELIRENKKCINKRIEGRGQKQYSQDNKDKISARKQQYHQDNKDKILAQKKQYRQDNKDKLSAKNQQYYEENKDKILAKTNQYYQDNKDKI